MALDIYKFGENKKSTDIPTKSITVQNSTTTGSGLKTTTSTSTQQSSYTVPQEPTQNIEDLISKKKKYVNLKEYLNNIVSYLNSSIKDMEVPTNKFNSAISIDTLSLPGKNLGSSKEALKSTKNTLVNTVIPEIDIQIRKLNDEIGGA